MPSKEDLDKFYDVETKQFNDDYLYQYIEEKVKAGVGDAILPRVRGREARWRWGADKVRNYPNEIIVSKTNNGYSLYKKQRPDIGDLPTRKPKTIFYKPEYSSGNGTNEVRSIFNLERIFSNPKPISLLKDILQLSTDKNSEHIILDFFAGSGTTGHAVMALNAEDGGNRKFILCQIDEPIAEGKPAYQFCIDNDLPPVISSITIERLHRAGSTLSKSQNFDKVQKTGGEDYGFKVFDHTNAPKLTQDENGQIVLPTLHNDALSCIYTMIFKVGLDEPSQAPQEVLKDCIYKIDSHYYLTNSENISKEDFSQTIKDATQTNGKIFVDGWTASLNATLQHYKEEVQIVF